MSDILFGRYFTVFEVLVDLLLVLLACVVVGGAVYLVVRRFRHGRSKGHEKRQTEGQPAYDGQHPKVSIDDLLSFVAHDFGSNLQYIMEEAKKTLQALGNEPTALRERQKGIFFAASDLNLHSENILTVFDPEPKELAMESRWTIQEIVRDVMHFLAPFAESNDVTLREILDEVGRTPINRDATVCVLRNLIQNAVKYSPGGVVEVRVYLADDEKDVAKKVIRVDVKDQGKGISEEVQKTLFELRRRANGLIEPGSGLGLYCALVVNRRQGGDVQLVESSEKGSTFRAIFPYRSIPEVPK
jgi:signal transduction histidine kinase